jgi:O-antigen ligase
MDLTFLRLPKENLLEYLQGIALALTLFSGALEVSLFLLGGLPPIIGPILFVFAAVLGLLFLARNADLYSFSPFMAASILLLFCYMIWGITSVAWSTSLTIVGGKFLAFAGYTPLFYLIGIAAGSSIRVRRGLSYGVVSLGLITVLASARAALAGTGALALAKLRGGGAANPVLAFASSYQSITLCIGAASVFALVEALTRRRGIAAACWTAAWLVLSMASLSGGGRSALIGSILAQIVILILAIAGQPNGQSKGRALSIMLILPGVAVSAFFVALQLRLRTIERFIDLASNSGDSSGRGLLWQRAMAMAEMHPLIGGGFGSYEATSNNFEDAGLYPHDTFLEALSETGIIGFTLLVAAVTSAAILGIRRLNRQDFFSTAVWSGLFVVAMVGAITSGTVTDRYLIVSLGMAMGMAASTPNSA